jgi:hypothetical protein
MNSKYLSQGEEANSSYRDCWNHDSLIVFMGFVTDQITSLKIRGAAKKHLSRF